MTHEEEERQQLISKLTKNFTNEQLARLIERLAEDKDLIEDMEDALTW